MTATDNLAINPLMMGGMDPYLYYALQSPNIYNPSFRGASDAASAPQSAASTQTAATSSTAIQTAQPADNVSEKKKNSAALPVLGIIALGAAGFFTHKAYKAGTGENFFKRVWNGVQCMFNGAKEKVLPKHATIYEVNGKQVISIPGEKNIINDNFQTELEKIGETVPETGDINKIIRTTESNGYSLTEGNELLEYSFSPNECEHYVVKYSADSSKDIQIFDTNLKNHVKIDDLKSTNDKAYKEIMNYIEQVRKGNINYNNLETVTVRNTSNGLVSKIEYTKGEKGKIKEIVTDKFSLSDPQVITKIKYKNAQDALSAYQKGDASKLTVDKAYYPCSLNNNNTSVPGKLVVDGKGKVLEFISKSGDSIKIGSDEFASLRTNNSTAFNNASNKDNWENIVYRLPASII